MGILTLELFREFSIPLHFFFPILRKFKHWITKEEICKHIDLKPNALVQTKPNPDNGKRIRKIIMTRKKYCCHLPVCY